MNVDAKPFNIKSTKLIVATPSLHMFKPSGEASIANKGHNKVHPLDPSSIDRRNTIDSTLMSPREDISCESFL